MTPRVRKHEMHLRASGIAPIRPRDDISLLSRATRPMAGKFRSAERQRQRERGGGGDGGGGFMARPIISSLHETRV